jgi:hypothetical protein
MDCTVPFTARSNSKVADLGKCWATELHLIGAQNFLSLDWLHEMKTIAYVRQNYMQLTCANIFRDLKYLNLFKIGQKYGALYIKTYVRFIGSGDTKSL